MTDVVGVLFLLWRWQSARIRARIRNGADKIEPAKWLRGWPSFPVQRAVEYQNLIPDKGTRNGFTNTFQYEVGDQRRK